MMRDIFTNMGHQKNPWDDVPIEVLIEYERKKKEERQRNQRQRLEFPMIAPPTWNKPENQEKDEDKIVIKFS